MGRGKEERRKEKKGTWWWAPRSVQPSLVYTLGKLEQLSHEYIFPSACFAPETVISGGDEAVSCRVWLSGFSTSSWQCRHLKGLLAEGCPCCLKQRWYWLVQKLQYWASWSSSGDLAVPVFCSCSSCWPARGTKKKYSASVETSVWTSGSLP